MGNASTCEFVDENGVKCTSTEGVSAYYNERYCKKHAWLLFLKRKRDRRQSILDSIAEKYGKDFLEDVTNMYSTTPIPKVRKEFEKILKKHGLVDDGTPYVDERYNGYLGTVFQHDMMKLNNAFESRILNPA